MRSSFQHVRELIASARRMRPHLRGGRYLIAAVCLTSVASAAMEGIGVGLLVPLLSLLLGGDSPTPMRPLGWIQTAFPGHGPSFYVVVLCTIIVAAIAAKNATLFTSQVLAAALKRRVSINLRDALFQRMLTADLSIYEQRTAGQMANVFMTETYRTFITIDYLLLGLQRTSMAALYGVGLLIISWELTLLTLGLGVGVGTLLTGIYRRLRRQGETLSECNQRLSSRLMETFAGIRVIRATLSQERELERFHQVNEAQACSEEQGTRSSQLLHPATETIAVLGAMMIVATAYFLLVRPGRMLPSYLLGYGFMLLRMLPLLNHLYVVQGQLISLGGSVREVERWLDTPIHPDRPFGSRTAGPLTDGLRFDAVSYRFPNGQVGLDSVSFTIPAGKTVALVGPSGSGKSTLASLLLRFRAPSAGKILADQIDYWELTPADWHRRVAVVEQEAFVFHATLRENIAFGAPNASEEQIHAAVKQAFLEDLVDRLPEGLNSVVGERGTMLSGGQRQRLAIARALLRNPEILILDEATSALDALSEKQVQAALNQAAKGRTVLVIAHRISTIRHADWIVVLERGRVVEQGRWEDLHSSGGHFARVLEAGQSLGT